MPFDTISLPKEYLDQRTQQLPELWAFHAEKRVFPKKLVLETVYVSALSSVILLSSCTVLAKPITAVDSVKTTIPGVSAQDKPTKTVPASVSIQGFFMQSMKPLSQQAVPLEAKAYPKAVKRGGFDADYLQAEKKFGVPWQIIAAVHYTETGQSGDTDVTSTAGAKGPMQFMQSTFDVYQQDGDGDGVKSINDVHDAIYTAAKQLAANGAGKGNLKGALYNYNHSYEYVERVLKYARDFGYSG